MLKAIKNKLNALSSEMVYRLAIINHGRKLPKLENEGDRQIVETLKRDGVYVTTLSELGIDSTTTLMHFAEKYLSQMAAVRNQALSHKLPQIYTMTDIPEFYDWGREDRILSIIENYMSLPVAYHGVHLRKDFPNAEQFDTLLWHKDAEDRKLIKIMIYLDDVDLEHGPFECIPGSVTPLYSRRYHQIYQQLAKSGHLGITDAEVEAAIPKTLWKTCTGVKGTVIFVDTKKCLHHGCLRTQERPTLHFVYTTNPPRRPELCTQYWDERYARPDSKTVELNTSSIG
ncbi:phytanoyl-CoA dioxygenase (PhyH) [Calothrix sp. 336/3]|uniref:phytanoyl-CoA dioxygenase (PhyH) n=1 Tax=Calothrix sp. 336/3 TaxID=1337936 RepID=UPI0004E40BEE|nr:phytanoyl-CoA dioxygenase (PhyH) [Calothrix sp. 336/3]AKG23276.1 phytanoyl-CoA dioxygenase (PhyH) [Calothrix sp. 336/3]